MLGKKKAEYVITGVGSTVAEARADLDNKLAEANQRLAKAERPGLGNPTGCVFSANLEYSVDNPNNVAGLEDLTSEKGFEEFLPAVQQQVEVSGATAQYQVKASYVVSPKQDDVLHGRTATRKKTPPSVGREAYRGTGTELSRLLE